MKLSNDNSPSKYFDLVKSEKEVRANMRKRKKGKLNVKLYLKRRSISFKLRYNYQ